MLDDYIDSAPEGSNEAITKPRYHGSPGSVGYMDPAGTVCAGGYCLENLFERRIEPEDPEYVGHTLDMLLGTAHAYWTHAMCEGESRGMFRPPPRGSTPRPLSLSLSLSLLHML